MGITSDTTFAETIDEYKDMTTSLNILNGAWNQTVSAARIQNGEHSVWEGAGRTLQLLAADLHGRFDMTKPTAACLGSSEYEALLRSLEELAKKVVL